MDKLLCIIGPTAIGKTKLALNLAQILNGILINCDSVQVYKGLDIISGKDLDIIKNTPIKLIDIVPPTYSFTVSDFVDYATATIELISQQQRPPILVGGTGFYLKALIDGIETIHIPPNQTLRIELENKNVMEISDLLQKENPDK